MFYCYLLLKVIEKYLKVTSDSYRNPKIRNVWEVDRETEVGTTISLVLCDTED